MITLIIAKYKTGKSHRTKLPERLLEMKIRMTRTIGEQMDDSRPINAVRWKELLGWWRRADLKGCGETR